MSTLKDEPHPNSGANETSNIYGLTIEQLKNLMEMRGKDLMEKLNGPELNGINGILEKLKVDPNKGLDSNDQFDLEQRQKVFGKNEIPPKPMKTFVRLCWDAFHDMLLVILLVCAIVSIGLSFYRPPSQGNDHEERKCRCDDSLLAIFHHFDDVSHENVFCLIRKTTHFNYRNDA